MMNAELTNDTDTPLVEMKETQERLAYRLILARLTAYRLEQELAAIKRLIEQKARGAR